MPHRPHEHPGRAARGHVDALRAAGARFALLDDDPPARVRWVATLRKIYADELPRMRRAHREFWIAPAVVDADRVVVARREDPSDLTDFVTAVARWVPDRH